jgi:hypothetical protein
MHTHTHSLSHNTHTCTQAWCVLGNFCSLQKDHESAVELFQRAIQLDPTFAYGYTLAGHEYFASEDYDKSLVGYWFVCLVPVFSARGGLAGWRVGLFSLLGGSAWVGV